MKKMMFLLLLIMVSFMLFSTEADTTTGTTTASFVDAYDSFITVANNSSCGVTLKNTGSSGNDVEYQVLVYMHTDATEYYVVASSDALADGETAYVSINDPCYMVKVQVKYPTAGAASTYSCSYVMKRL